MARGAHSLELGLGFRAIQVDGESSTPTLAGDALSPAPTTTLQCVVVNRSAERAPALPVKSLKPIAATFPGRHRQPGGFQAESPRTLALPERCIS
ncbi:MAG TPA: hypothetical protein VJA21_16445 [Verrucomicrobiae bacterium]